MSKDFVPGGIKLMELFPKIGVRVAIPPTKGDFLRHKEAGYEGEPPVKRGVVVGWSEKNGGTIVAKIQLDTRKQVSVFQSKRLVIVES